MRNAFIRIFFLASFFVFSRARAQTHTVGLFAHLSGSEDDGYVLFTPQYSDSTYLIDKCGQRVHSWASAYTPGLDVYLLPDGTLLRAGNYPNPYFGTVGSAGGVIERLDWNGGLLWHYIISDATQTQNHDICYMPNGHILVAIWEKVTAAQAIAYGRDTAKVRAVLWLGKIEEIVPIGTDSAQVVWTWRIWDHLIQDHDATKPNYGVIGNHPELLNFNYINIAAVADTTSDWLHMNAVTYNEALDQVMISFHNTDEIYILDHSTTTAQAATHTGGRHNKGGDFLYRWGNPAAYDHGTAADTKLFEQHDPIWIPYGKYANQIMVFNNGNGRGLFGFYYSSVDIIDPPVDSAGNYTLMADSVFGPSLASWSYATSGFYSAFEGGAQPLANGNILICDALKGHLFEIDSTKRTVWNYINPDNAGAPVAQGGRTDSNSVYRCLFYPSSYEGFRGLTFDLPRPIELNPLPYTCSLGITSVAADDRVTIAPNPAADHISVDVPLLTSLTLQDMTGRTLFSSPYRGTHADLNISAVPNGLYLLCINGRDYHKIVIQH